MLDNVFVVTAAITVLAGIAAALLVVRPTAGRVAIAKGFAKIALAGAIALFALLKN
ncbi:hypothetical protein [Mesorhizobium sp. IMUNJ 23232]|uniref:hypothetical protein n=1 Tax=Mesorhizobium sp. IMUNJ 23232 TaxID=3376064 RepID=UPI0037B38BF1